MSSDATDEVNLLSDAESTIYKEPIIKRRNPKRKSAPLQRSRDRLARATKKAQSNDVEFTKQVPAHPRDRLTRATKKDVEFWKPIPLHPRDKLRRKTKILKHTKDTMKEKELKVAMNKFFALMQEKFVFDPEHFQIKLCFLTPQKLMRNKTDRQHTRKYF